MIALGRAATHEGVDFVLDVVVRKGIRFLSVDGVITDLQLLLSHTKWHAKDVFDEAQDERGPDDVPADDEQPTDDLKPDLSAISINSATWVAVAEGSNAIDCREDTCSNTTDKSTNEMGVEDLESVVNVGKKAF